MKKLISSLFALAVIVSMTVLTSCGGGVDNAKVGKIVEKSNNNEQLTEADYGTLLDYVDAAMDDALPIFKDVQAAIADGDMEKVASLKEKAEKLETKYPYMNEALSIIEYADDSELGAANQEKGKKILEKMTSVGLNPAMF